MDPLALIQIIMTIIAAISDKPKKEQLEIAADWQAVSINSPTPENRLIGRAVMCYANADAKGAQRIMELCENCAGIVERSEQRAAAAAKGA